MGLQLILSYAKKSIMRIFYRADVHGHILPKTKLFQWVLTHDMQESNHNMINLPGAGGV